MNKTKKTLLITSSILTIVGFAGALLLTGFMFLCGAVCSEQLIKETYLYDKSYTHETLDDGSYQFILNELDEDEIEVITEKEIETIAKLTRAFFFVSAITMLGFSVAKFVLAIKILSAANKNQYKKGCTIGLLVLSILNSNFIESIWIIIAMCLNDNKEN